jgi:hypothetical protein
MARLETDGALRHRGPPRHPTDPCWTAFERSCGTVSGLAVRPSVVQVEGKGA